MIKKILIVLAVLAVVLLGLAGVVAMQPAEFTVARSARVAAPAPAVFAQVNDFRNWEAWSPWAKLDPAAKSSFAGPSAGQGAVFRWSGNDKVGEGQMMLTESRPSDRVRIKVDMVRPFEGTSFTEFTFRSEGDRTAVTWSMTGTRNFIAKAFCLIVDGEKMLADEMDKGLAQMKAIVEAPGRK